MADRPSLATMVREFAAYRSDPKRYDELRGGDAVRAHWEALYAHLRGLGPAGARRTADLVNRLVAESGVTYNVYADPQGRDRPWLLDPLPVVLAASEWQKIEAGLLQRAELLNALLADLYGPQELIADGLIPTELAFGHSNYLWPCRGVRPPGGTWLHVLAVDLARSPDGKWWVLGDRAQTPSGPGYALENRQIISRAYPDLTKELGVRSISGVFAGLREKLLSAAQDDASPLAVVLTPGPFNETYFEHAYLARHLGVPLVEGRDLTVRGENVYLKTLGGLKRVHAILRRLDDDFCDPVELRADSALGVPGLLGAIRAGHVVMANALGSGVLDSPAWQGFLPAIAEQLTGQKLLLPSVATWWCGEAPALEDAIHHLDKVIIKGTYPNQRFTPVFGDQLDAVGREQLVARLRSRPYAYVAQERVRFSQAPVWRSSSDMTLDARPFGIRAYVIATPSGYAVMPGGMARIASETALDIISTQRGGGSKDLWVLSESSQVQAAQSEDTPDRLMERHAELPSDLVENLHWLGRYSERCVDNTRLLRATFSARADSAVWSRALSTCRDLGLLAEEGEPLDSLLDPALPTGLAADLGRLAWAATRSRSRLSAEHWRSLTLLQKQVEKSAGDLLEPRAMLDHLLVGLAAMAGFSLDDMTQDDGWRFLMLGRLLERMRFQSNLFASMLYKGRLPIVGELEWLLDVSGSVITYRTRYLSTPRMRPVLELLVVDTANPRALAFHWQGVNTLLGEISRTFDMQLDDSMNVPMQALTDAVYGGNLDGRDARARLARQRVSEAAAEFSLAVDKLSDRLATRYFSHTSDAQKMVAA